MSSLLTPISRVPLMSGGIPYRAHPTNVEKIITDPTPTYIDEYGRVSEIPLASSDFGPARNITRKSGSLIDGSMLITCPDGMAADTEGTCSYTTQCIIYISVSSTSSTTNQNNTPNTTDVYTVQWISGEIPSVGNLVYAYQIANLLSSSFLLLSATVTKVYIDPASGFKFITLSKPLQVSSSTNATLFYKKLSSCYPAGVAAALGYTGTDISTCTGGLTSSAVLPSEVVDRPATCLRKCSQDGTCKKVSITPMPTTGTKAGQYFCSYVGNTASTDTTVGTITKSGSVIQAYGDAGGTYESSYADVASVLKGSCTNNPLVNPSERSTSGCFDYLNTNLYAPTESMHTDNSSRRERLYWIIFLCISILCWLCYNKRQYIYRIFSTIRRT